MPFSSVTEIFVTSVAGRRCKGSNLLAQLGYDPWGPQGSTSSRGGTSSLCLTAFYQDNILIDQTGNARLADFGLVTMHLDSTTSSSREQGGSSRWMSPELFEPRMFGVEDNRRTKASDCYALGMTVYEVLTGRMPFPRHFKDVVVTLVLYKGDRPKRPQGAEGKWFTDDVWGILGRCWEPKPGDRPSIDEVLQRLEEASMCWTPLPLLIEDGSQQPDSSSTVTEHSIREVTDGGAVLLS